MYLHLVVHIFHGKQENNRLLHYLRVKQKSLPSQSPLRESLYLRLLCKDFNIQQLTVTTIYCDNQGAIALTKESPKKHQRTKHIDVRFNFIRSQKNVHVEYVCSKDNLADIMTKSLGKLNHNKSARILQYTDIGD